MTDAKKAAGSFSPRAALGIALGLLFLGFAVWGVPIDQLETALRRVDFRTMLVIGGLATIQQFLRAIRQWVLLLPHAPGISLRRQFSIYFLSFVAISTLPARTGELIRPLMLNRSEGLAMSRGLAMVVVERVIEIVALLAVLSFVLRYADAESAAGRVALASMPFVWLALPILLGGLALVVWRGPELTARWRTDTNEESSPLRTAVFGFVDGLGAQRSIPHVAVAFALTFGCFACMAGSAFALAATLGMGQQIGLAEGLGVLAITMLGLVLPSPPGQIGVFEGSMVAALAVFGVGEAFSADALAFALVSHWWPFTVLLFWTVVFVLIDREGLHIAIGRAGEPTSQPEAHESGAA